MCCWILATLLGQLVSFKGGQFSWPVAQIDCGDRITLRGKVFHLHIYQGITLLISFPPSHPTITDVFLQALFNESISNLSFAPFIEPALFTFHFYLKHITQITLWHHVMVFT